MQDIPERIKEDIDNYNIDFKDEKKFEIQFKELECMKKKLSSIKKQKKDLIGIIKYCECPY